MFVPLTYAMRGWNSIVIIVRVLLRDSPGIKSWWGWAGEIFCTWGPHSLLYNRYWVFFPSVKRKGRGVDHPTQLELGLKKE